MNKNTHRHISGSLLTSTFITENGVYKMNDEIGKKQVTHPVIRKCMQHLDVIEANDKTKQIVYMYLKAMDQEIETLKDKNS